MEPHGLRTHLESRTKRQRDVTIGRSAQIFVTTFTELNPFTLYIIIQCPLLWVILLPVPGLFPVRYHPTNATFSFVYHRRHTILAIGSIVK